MSSILSQAPTQKDLDDATSLSKTSTHTPSKGSKAAVKRDAAVAAKAEPLLFSRDSLPAAGIVPRRSKQWWISLFAVCVFASTLFGAVVIHVNRAVPERKGQVAVAKTQHAPSKV